MSTRKIRSDAQDQIETPLLAARLTLTDHREGKVSEAASENSSILSMFGGFVLRSEVFQSCSSAASPEQAGVAPLR